MCGQEEKTNQCLKLSEKELIVLWASVSRYITYLTKSNNRILHSLGYEDGLIDCEDKRLLIDKAKNIQQKIVQNLKNIL